MAGSALRLTLIVPFKAGEQLLKSAMIHLAVRPLHTHAASLSSRPLSMKYSGD